MFKKLCRFLCLQKCEECESCRASRIPQSKKSALKQKEDFPVLKIELDSANVAKSLDPIDKRSAEFISLPSLDQIENGWIQLCRGDSPSNQIDLIQKMTNFSQTRFDDDVSHYLNDFCTVLNTLTDLEDDETHSVDEVLTRKELGHFLLNKVRNAPRNRFEEVADKKRTLGSLGIPAEINSPFKPFKDDLASMSQSTYFESQSDFQLFDLKEKSEAHISIRSTRVLSSNEVQDEQTNDIEKNYQQILRLLRLSQESGRVCPRSFLFILQDFPPNLQYMFEVFLYQVDRKALKYTLMLQIIVLLIMAGHESAHGLFHGIDRSFINSIIFLAMIVGCILFNCYAYYRSKCLPCLKQAQTIEIIVNSIPFIFELYISDPTEIFNSRYILYCTILWLWHVSSNTLKSLVYIPLAIYHIILKEIVNETSNLFSQCGLFCAVFAIGISFNTLKIYLRKVMFMNVRMYYQYQKNLFKARAEAENLLREILPYQIVAEFKVKRKKLYAVEESKRRSSGPLDHSTRSRMGSLKKPEELLQGDFKNHENVAILFGDIVGFTEFSSKVTPEYLVACLACVFEKFDILAAAFGLEKIKTIGDCYQVCGGLFDSQTDREEIKKMIVNIITFGSCMIRIIEDFSSDIGHKLQLRVGIHFGSVLGGIIGRNKFKYDVWSSDVGVAEYLEQTAEKGKIHVSDRVREFLVDESKFVFTFRSYGSVAPGLAPLKTWSVSQIWSNLIELTVDKSILVKLEACSVNFEKSVKENTILSPKQETEEVEEEEILLHQIAQGIERQEHIKNNQYLIRDFNEKISKKYASAKPALNIIGRFKNASLENGFIREHFSRNYKFVSVAAFGMICVYIFMLNLMRRSADSLPQFVSSPVIYVYPFFGIIAIVFFLFRLWMLYMRRPSIDDLEFGRKKKITSRIKNIFTNPDPFITIFVCFLATGLLSYTMVFSKQLDKATLSYVFLTFELFFIALVMFSGAGSNYLSFCSFLVLLGLTVVFCLNVWRYSDSQVVTTGDLITSILYPWFSWFITVRASAAFNRVLRRNFCFRKYLTSKTEEYEYVKTESDSLLENSLPVHVAKIMLKDSRTKRYVDKFVDLPTLFVKIVNLNQFRNQAEEKDKSQLKVLNKIFSKFDQVLGDFGVEKIKTTGNMYMVMAGGLPSFKEYDKNPTQRLLDFTSKLYSILHAVGKEERFRFEMQSGMNCGPAVGGVIGLQRFCFDIWGDAVNLAARMQQNGVCGYVQVTESVVRLAGNGYSFVSRGKVNIKGKGLIDAFLYNPRQNGKSQFSEFDLAL